MSDFKLLAQRDIIDILIGDTVVLEKDDKQIRLPYLSGPMLCAISTKFGLDVHILLGEEEKVDGNI